MSISPRILQISNLYLHHGGEEESVARIARQVSTFAEVERCLFDSRQWTGPRAPFFLTQARWMLKNPAALRSLMDLDARFQPDAWLVHNVFPVGSAAVYDLARQLGRPVVQYLHNYRPLSVSGYNWVGGRIARGSIRSTYLREIMAASWKESRARTAWFSVVLAHMRRSPGYRSIGAWVAVSKFLRSRFVDAGFPAERVFAIRHSWEVLNAQLPVHEDRGYYLFFGRLVDQKGIAVLLEAWSMLEKKLGPATPVLSICGEGPLEACVRTAVSRSPFVRFHGYVTGLEKDRLLREARAMIAPSLWWEPLGLVTYEAYDYGKPMLAAASGGLSETVSHGKTGFLHQPGDAAALAEQVARLEAQPAMAAAMGRCGREWLLGNTGEATWARQFTEVLDIVLKRPDQRHGSGRHAKSVAVSS